jgi:recombination protein RecA
MEGTKFVGIKSQLKVVKNKVAPPFKIVMLSIMFGKGIDKGGDLKTHLMDEGRVERRGSNYYIDGDVRIGIGGAEADKWLATEFTAYNDSLLDSKDEEKSKPKADAKPDTTPKKTELKKADNKAKDKKK